VAEIIDETLRQIGYDGACLLDRVRGLWPGLVGPDVARRTQVAALQNGVLTVEVASAPWLYVLEREHRARIRERVREATAGAVAEVRLVPPGRFAGHRSGGVGTPPADGM
jgi:predicted nucleic acid-binding Zn ribbon protein